MATKPETSYAKTILLCANFIFAIIGLLYLIMNTLIKNQFDRYTCTMITVFGLLLLFFSYLGFISKLKDDDFLAIIFSACLLVIFIVEMCIGLSALQPICVKLKNDIEYCAEPSMITKYSQDHKWKSKTDELQIEMKCCGFNGPKDWTYKHMAIPSSCYITRNSSLIYTTGCQEKLKNHSINNTTDVNSTTYTNTTEENKEYNKIRYNVSIYATTHKRMEPIQLLTLLG